jgi:hypothetical protein
MKSANYSTPLQSLSTPSNFTAGTTDATVFTLAKDEYGFIQNLDDAALYYKIGAGCTTSSFSGIIKAGSAANDGNGGYVVFDRELGPISVAAATGTARYIAWKKAY